LRFAVLLISSLLVLPVAASAQFQHVRAQVAAPELARSSTICDTSAFPPFNRHGPWTFSLCDEVDAIVMTCAISASALAKDKLPAAMLRRALLRMMEEYETSLDGRLATQGALTMDCAPHDTAAS